MTSKKGARNRADIHFSAGAARDAQVKEEVAKERVAFELRTQKLRALRLAHEAQEEARKASEPAPAKARKPRKG